MTPSSPNPKLPNWIFWLSYAILLLTAWLIARGSGRPMSATAIFSIVACVIVGACIATVPIVYHYERKKNETLDDRQRALEVLAHTIAASADQISIATKGLHEITELAQKNLRLAEQLPTQFQDKITEFETLLTSAQVDERDELKKELAQLRASESDRLEAIANKVDHAVGELTKLEATAQKHLKDAQAALARAPEALTSATTAALARIESALAASPAAAPQDEPRRSAKSDGGAAIRASSKPTEEGLHIIPIAPPTAAPFAGDIVSIAPEVTVAPFAGSFFSSVPLTDASPAATPPDEPRPSPTGEGGAATPAPEEPKPAKKPRAPRKPKPADDPALGLKTGEPATAAAPADEFSQSAPDDSPKPSAEVMENVISSDGATRLVVTAYIGIGNRLFIRGEGPGLSWDKGVPLQFVSIGKWRWETDDSTAPVKFKLYKNDEVECIALGSQSLSPGHQQEITATF